MTGRDQVIYRHLPQFMLPENGTPSFDLAMRFVYDRSTGGTPTLPKLAREAIRRMEPSYSGYCGMRDGSRVWIWKDDGEFIGSIWVVVVMEPRLVSLDNTIERGLPS